MHAPPPPTPAGILPAYSGAPPTHLPPPTSSGAPLPPVSLTSSASDDQARITALEGTVNQMATNMVELLALFRGPNRASSSSTPPLGQGPIVDPTPRVPPTQAPENMDAPAPPTLHASMAHPFTSPYPPPPAPTAVTLPPTTFLSSEQALSAPPPISIPLLAGDQIRPISPGPNFDPSVQDQSKRCEYHQGAPGHTLDNCWRLRDEIQRRIDNNRLTFNAVRPPNVQDNPLPDHRPNSGSSINMISICASRRDEDTQDNPLPFVIDYTPEEPTVGFTGNEYEEFVIHSFQDSLLGSALDWFMSLKAEDIPTWEDLSRKFIDQYRVTEEEAEAFMKIVKASEYEVVKQMAKSPAHISLLALLLGSEPHREALLRVLTSAQVPKETPPDRIDETIGSIFSNTISFSDDELPSEGWSHSWALHIVCKCNNYIIGRVMIDNGAALNVCPVTTLKQMNVDLNRIRPSKTAVQAFDGSRRKVNGEIDLLIDVGPCSFSITFQVLDIPNAFSLLLGRPWIHSADTVPSSLHQRLKFIVEEKLVTVKGEEDYAIYKETAEINVGTEEEPRTLKIGTALNPTQRARMIDFLKEYQEVFALSYADMPGLDPSIVEHFLLLDTEKFPPKRQQLRRQRASLLLHIKEEVVKQINAGFLEVCKEGWKGPILRRLPRP
ncbi:hypothetical protein CRG98_023450 [Punica granatum]|uniref:Retrotransposon gag domain-containing protein n=1 Tax=Punica granatum TaxID=22663 RepID=A0A2I0JJL7_PUNGR|nr:hypothetical protein CRG98_023450 [Punica granatum]